MGGDDKVTSVLGKFGVKKTPETPTEATVHDIRRKKPYIAAEIDRSGERVRRLRVYFSNGEIGLPNYLNMSDAVLETPNYLGMIFDTGSIHVEGQHLDKLLDDLQDERIRVLRPFDAEQHEPPATGEPVIERITLRTREAIRREIEAEEAPEQ